MTNDPYSYPQTGVLINKLNIKSQKDLQLAESEYSANRLYQLRTAPIKGNFDLEHLKKIHKYIFQDIYKWAGEIRTVNIEKQDKFAASEQIESYANYIFKQLNKEGNLKGLQQDKFCNRAAHYMGEINAIHPFREGNGRTQREFIRELAANAGYELDFRHVTSEEMKEASIHSFREDPSKLEEILQRSITPLHDHQSEESYLKQTDPIHNESYGMD
ncbi:Fic family protein [Salmonella enterica]